MKVIKQGVGAFWSLLSFPLRAMLRRVCGAGVPGAGVWRRCVNFTPFAWKFTVALKDAARCARVWAENRGRTGIARVACALRLSRVHTVAANAQERGVLECWKNRIMRAVRQGSPIAAASLSLAFSFPAFCQLASPTGNYYSLQNTNQPALNLPGWTLGQILFTANYGLTNITFDPVPRSGRPMMFFEAVEADNEISITDSHDAVEPGPNNQPPAQNGYFRVTRIGGSSAVTVLYGLSGTAINGVDYTTVPGTASLPLSPGYVDIIVQPLADNLVEFEEPVTLTLVLTNGYVIEPNTGSATITISDSTNSVFMTVVTNLVLPIGIDYSPTANALLVSVNYGSESSGGDPFNFLEIHADGSTNQWSGVANLPGEIKLATVKTTTNGFTQGEMYFGSGAGRIGKLDPAARCPALLGRRWTIPIIFGAACTWTRPGCGATT